MTHAFSRRNFCLCCIAATTFSATGWLTPREVFAKAGGIVDMIKDSAAKAPISIHKLRGNVSVLEGSGGNIAVLNGPDGKILVDAGIGVSRVQVKAALARLGPQPISTLINTHWHFDHADGNEWLHGEGAHIIAHKNTRTHLSSAQRVEDWSFDFPPSPAGAIPGEVMEKSHTLNVNGDTLTLEYYGPAHTDGDISVRFAEADILHTGDTYWNGVYPFVDYSTGGSIDGMIMAAKKNIAASTDKTIIVPGHGPISNRAQMIESFDMLSAIRDKVASLKNKGLSLDEVVAARPTAAFDDKWGQFVIDPAFFTRLTYVGV